MSTNKQLLHAQQQRDDEFYTRYEDIEKELSNYIDVLRNKIVYCNCDNPETSNFVKYFKDNFKRFHLKKLIATNYSGLPMKVQLSLFEDIEEKETPYYFEYDGKTTIQRRLRQNGSFDSEECIEILKTADVVITNPPFSILKKYTNMLLKYNKKFLFIGPFNVITYGNNFNYVKTGEMKVGFTEPHYFIKNGEETAVNCVWFTNLEVEPKREPLPLTKTYNPDYYPKYENYDAIEVRHYKDIPADYTGNMGVPITFIKQLDYNQFELVGLLGISEDLAYLPPLKRYGNEIREVMPDGTKTGRKASRHKGCGFIKGKADNKIYNYDIYTGEENYVVYCRLLIKNKTLQ